MGDEELTLVLKLRDEATAQMKKSQKGIGGSLKSIAKVAAAAGLAIGAAVGTAGVKLFKLASDADEVTNVLHLAFGSMSKDVEVWAATFATATGTSKFEARKLAGDLGLIIAGMNLGEQATFDISTRMTELARDMASAKNVRFEDALEKIRAGLLGEAEPLRIMGVRLSAVRVKELAYAKGIAKRGEELTETNKLEARMQIILADSIKMHGDAANTIDSSANKWVTIKSKIKDTTTELGQFFMPVFVDVLDYMRQGVDVSIELSKELYASSKETSRWTLALDQTWVALDLTWAAVGPVVTILKDGLWWVMKTLVIPVIEGMVDKFNTLIKNLETGYNWMADWVPGMKALEDKGRDAALSVGDLSTGVGDLGTELGLAETPARDLSYAMAGDSVGGSLAPSAEAAEAALDALRDETGRLLLKQEDALLVTDKQWVAYQNLWPEADKNADILSSKMIPALSTLSTTGLPSVTTGLIGPGGISEALATTGGASTTFLETMATAISPENITGIFTAAFTGAGGALGALKAIGAQLVSALATHFLTPLSTSIFNGIKGIFMGGAGAAAGAAGGAGAAGAGAAGSGLGFTGVMAAIPGWGWAAPGLLRQPSSSAHFGITPGCQRSVARSISRA